MTTRTKRRWDGRLVPMLFVAFFGVVIAVNGVFIFLSLSTWNGLTTDNAYVRGLNYNQVLNAADDQVLLGWRSTAALRDDVLIVSIRSAGGDPVDDLEISATWRRPARADLDQQLRLTAIGGGDYRAAAPLPEKGQWDLHVLARGRQNETYRQEFRLWVD